MQPNKSTLKDGAVITIGQPFRPGHPFYEQAAAFRAALERLGIPCADAVQEFATAAAPALARVPDGTRSVKIVLALEIVDKHGRKRLVRAKATP